MSRKISSGMFFGRIFLAVLLSFILFSGSVFTATAAVGPPELEWSLDAQMVIPEPEPAESGGWAKTDLIDPLLARLNAEGVTTELIPPHSGVDGLSFSLRASARGSVDDFRRILYTIMMPEFDLLGGVTEMSISSDVKQCPDVELVIEANPSTGFGWHVASDSAFTAIAPDEYLMHTRGYGVPQRQVLRLSMGAAGNTIKLVYKRQWEDVSATRHFTLKLSHLPAKLDLSDPMAPIDPLPEVQGFLDENAFPPAPEKGLPASWDWRTQGIVTPVRDQGSCGSCWAFGTVGIMESSLWKNGVANKDLSEQFLVSCNTHEWDCSGGLTASMYHYDRVAKNQTVAGAVLEADKPYTASNSTCTQSYNHPYNLTDWDFIVPNEFTMPTVNQIKTAIYTYGPVTAGVCAGSGWDGYSSGIFSTDETSQCGGWTNHQIDLVGWNDNGGNGYWILRNSWNTTWGINGYMYIAYNTSRVGEGTSWVTTPRNITFGTLTPSMLTSAPGIAQTFTAVYIDGDGYADLKYLYLKVGSTANGIYLRYDRTTNKLYLYNDAGTATVGSCTPETAGTLQNSQGSLNCAATKVVGSGTNLTVNYNITPKAAFASATKKNLYLFAKNMSNATAGWTDKGDWTVMATNVAPTLGALTPSVLTSAPGIAKTFKAIYSDADGYSNIKQTYLRVDTAANGIYLRYDRTPNKLYLYNDAGTATVGSCTPETAGTLQNSRGRLNCAATTVAASDKNLTINWNITPKAAFASTIKKNLYMYVCDMSNLKAGWTDKGDWTITTGQ